MRRPEHALAAVAIVLASVRAEAQQWAPQPPIPPPPAFGQPAPAPYAPPPYAPPAYPPPNYGKPAPPSATPPYAPPPYAAPPGTPPYAPPGLAPPGFAPPAPPPAFGVTLPPASPPTPAVLATIRQLDQAKVDDSGRRLTFVWVEARGGFEQLGMQAFSGNPNFVAGFVKTSSSGGVVDVAAGAQLLFLTLLLRGRVGAFDSGQLYRVGPEIGFHVPFGRVEPHVAFGLGYAGMGGLKETVALDSVSAAAFSMRGFYTRLDAGIDYYPTPVFSIGADLSAELTGLFRTALTQDEVIGIQNDVGAASTLGHSAPLLEQAGTGWGGTIALTGVAAFHF